MFESLAEIDLSGELGRSLRLGPEPLKLWRTWPRAPDHLLLEYTDGAGGIVAGQWIPDTRRLARVAAETARRCPEQRPAVSPRQRIVLQPRGADRRLGGLPALVARRGATLLAHRAERRAVVKLTTRNGPRFAKALPADQLRRLLQTVRRLHELRGRPFAIPQVIDVDEPGGVVLFSALGGVSVYEMLRDTEALASALPRVGEALRWLHEQTLPQVGVHDQHAEIKLLTKRLNRLQAIHSDAHRQLGDAPARVLARLAARGCRRGLLHRDFYDKQIVIHTSGSLGLLDFDTLAVGERALDVANMLSHLELRAVQGRCSPADAAAAATAFLAGYQPEPDVQARLGAYQDASRLRLACLYALRPRWRHLTPQLVKRIGLEET